MPSERGLKRINARLLFDQRLAVTFKTQEGQNTKDKPSGVDAETDEAENKVLQDFPRRANDLLSSTPHH